MAIKKTGTEFDQDAQQSAPQGNQQQHTYGGSVGQTDHSYNNPDDLFEGIGIETLSGGVDTEGFEAFTTEMTRLCNLPDVTRTLRIKIVPVTSQKLKVPVLAMVTETKFGHVVYSLLIEGMMPAPLDPVKEVYRGGPQAGGGITIIDTPTSWAYDDGLRAIVTQTVATQLSVPPNKIVHQHHCVVPKGADLTSSAVTRAFFDTAMLALINVAAKDKVRGVTHQTLVNRAGVITQKTYITPGQTRRSRSGMPLASDFNITLELSRAQQQRRDLNTPIHSMYDKKYVLADVSGFIDFTVADHLPPANQQWPNQVPTVPKFIPTFILNEITGLAPNGQSIEDMRTQLLGIAGTSAITTNSRWVRVYEKNIGSKGAIGVGKTSIGSLGLAHWPFLGQPPEYGVIEIVAEEGGKAPKAGSMTAKQVADSYCTKGVVVGMDIEQGGRLQWIQDLFIAAAGSIDDPNTAKASAKIIAECDILTNGHFSKLWAAANGGMLPSIMSPTTVVVHLGTYIGPDSQKRDLRSLDFPTLLRQMPKDPEKLREATTALIPGGCNAVTLTNRKEALERITGGLEITGLATRVFFKRGAIQTLVNALIISEIRITSDDNLDYGYQDNYVRMNFELADDISSGGLYHGTAGGPGAPNVPGQGYHNPLLW